MTSFKTTEAVADPVTCASTIAALTRTFFMPLWKPCFWSLTNSMLRVGATKHEVELGQRIKTYTVVRGTKWDEKPFGLQIETIEVGTMYACLSTKSLWAAWIHAFLLLDLKRGLHRSLSEIPLPSNHQEPVSDAKRRVSFAGYVQVREIPALSDDESDELFYNKSELLAFKIMATQLRTSFASVHY
ncbi:hypothetical protein SDRG_15002 [Saprolegnia diclina VS20]|uniref:PH domain-containing protein n=1 Tax=Saprolegnia diclina (strain VS20) TaxID=1156394 RepID=T0Q1E8_SAPDV|nr:hypothetical protein SDRG_15002 [Saprolegnia diclina VS20]EQC27200.1 hypothetical protein SDRG_15002 [Saprolegnia diclina VS20]|eukprot:XP_008619387.1 hypothetical protein SDRG_15002 [Saprolegnia diclina VS20]